jgi:hypothetical protein
MTTHLEEIPMSIDTVVDLRDLRGLRGLRGRFGGAFHDDDTHARLRDAKTRMDPRSLIHANHRIEA